MKPNAELSDKITRFRRFPPFRMAATTQSERFNNWPIKDSAHNHWKITPWLECPTTDTLLTGRC